MTDREKRAEYEKKAITDRISILDYETIIGRLGVICGNSSVFSSKISEDKKIKMMVYKTLYSMLHGFR